MASGLMRDVRAKLRRALKCEKVIVSLTSYPPRMAHIARSLQTVLDQSVKPDAVLLWLAVDDFPNRLSDLPEDLLALRDRGLDIRFTDEDLKLHNKYFWAIREYPDDVVITVDDDVLYRPEMVETLLEGYRLHPEAVQAMRAHKILFDDQGNLLPYNDWQFEWMEQLFEPRFDLLATGVSGVLYPPRCLESSLMTKENIDLCIHADDIWLKVVEIYNRVPVCVCSDFKPTHVTVEDSQGVARWLTLNQGGGNDRQIAAVLDKLDDIDGAGDTVLGRIRAS